jgi:flagellar biosynthesis GTPase FlhF
VWEEKAVPTVVFEVTSAKTRREDAVEKPRAYAQVGIVEYFIFDPLDEYLRPRLQGFRLGPHGYEPLLPDDDGRLSSQELGLLLVPEAAVLRLIDARTGVALPTLDELESQAAKTSRAMKRVTREAERAKQDAETAKQDAETAKRDAESAKQDAESAKRDAETAKQDAETANRRADAERRRAAALEEELKRLRRKG